jgi:AcrR family transcriptional regulator
MSVKQETGDDQGLELGPREEEIVRSAYRVITGKGGHRLSLQDIADEAGVSKGLILYHFKRKDRLFATTMRWALLGTARRIREHIATVDDPAEALDALLAAVFISPKQNRDFTLLYLDLVEHGARVASFGEVSAMSRAIINGLYAEVIAWGVQTGVYQVDDVEVAASQMRALIEGTLIGWLQDDWERTHALHRDQCAQALRRLLGVAV